MSKGLQSDTKKEKKTKLILENVVLSWKYYKGKESFEIKTPRSWCDVKLTTWTFWFLLKLQ